MTQVKDTHFKFSFVDEEGQEESILANKKGSFNGSTIFLDIASIPAAAIVDLKVLDNRMIISFTSEDDTVRHCVVQISGISASKLKGIIDTSRSAKSLRLEKEAFESKGQGHLFRATECKHCSSCISLSLLPETPQIYCQFCDTLTTIKPSADTPEDEKQCRICDECGMFGKPRKFTIFYFYFFFFFFGWHFQSTWRCPGCMRGEAWKMLFGNLIFIIGVPVAIAQLIRSYSDYPSSKFSGLDRANIKSRKGRSDLALKTYQKISKRVPVSSGLKYNIGLSLTDRKPDLALDALEMAYADCSNYPPVFNALCQLYTQNQQFDRLNELRRQWQQEEITPEGQQPEHQTPLVPSI